MGQAVSCCTKRMKSLDMRQSEKTDFIVKELNKADQYIEDGNRYNERAEHKKALECYFLAYNNYLRLYGEDDKNIGLVLNNIALVYRNLSDYKNALKIYQEALSIYTNNYSKEKKKNIIESLFIEDKFFYFFFKI